MVQEGPPLACLASSAENTASGFSFFGNRGTQDMSGNNERRAVPRTPVAKKKSRSSAPLNRGNHSGPSALTWDDSDGRIRAVLGVKGHSALPAATRTLQSKYFKYLATHLCFPFPAAYWNHNDSLHTCREITVTRLLEEPKITHEDGIFCEAREGNRLVRIPLFLLIVDAEEPNVQLTDDYSWWMLVAGHGDWDDFDFDDGELDREWR